MEVRFPDVDWFCDNCNSHLNKQHGFDDRKYIWKCKKCGYKNSISAANIRYENPVIHNVIGFLLGFTRSFLVYTVTILFLAEIIFDHQSFTIFGHSLLVLCAAAYPISMVLSLFFERVVAKYGIHKPLAKWIIPTILVNFWGDYFRPFYEVLSFPFALLNLIRLKLKGITFTRYFRQKCLYAVSYLCLLLFVVVIFWKSHLYLLFA